MPGFANNLPLIDSWFSPDDPHDAQQEAAVAGDKRRAMMSDEDLRAEKQLRSRFKIVDQLAPDALPNAITERELDQMIKLFEDIQDGRGDLTIDTSELGEKDANATRDAYMENIARIMQTKEGRQLLGEASNNVQMVDGKPVHRHTTLRGYHFDANGNGSHGDAADFKEDLTFGNAETIAADALEERYHPDGNGDLVRGKGSDSTVLMTPQSPWWGGKKGELRSDTVLFHELVHARHMARGDNDASQVKGSDGVPEDAVCPGGLVRLEHQAVGIGLSRNDAITEDRYRAARAALGQAHAPGALPDDETMRKRLRYGCGTGESLTE